MVLQLMKMEMNFYFMYVVDGNLSYKIVKNNSTNSDNFTYISISMEKSINMTAEEIWNTYFPTCMKVSRWDVPQRWFDLPLMKQPKVAKTELTICGPAH